MQIFRKKDTAAYCPECESLLFVLKQDVHYGEKVSTTQVYQNKGQAPFKQYEKVECKVCNYEVTKYDCLERIWLVP